MKSKSTAAILAFFLGGLGFHRFYLGDNGLGLLYFLMSWTLIPAFIAMVETFYFLLMSDQDFDMKYNRQMNYLPAPQHHAPQQIGQNVTVNMPSASAGTPVDVADQLGKLNDLRVAGAITDDEYMAQKRKLLT